MRKMPRASACTQGLNRQHRAFNKTINLKLQIHFANIVHHARKMYIIEVKFLHCPQFVGIVYHGPASSLNTKFSVKFIIENVQYKIPISKAICPAVVDTNILHLELFPKNERDGESLLIILNIVFTTKLTTCAWKNVNTQLL